MNAVVDLSRLPGVWRGGELDHAAPPGFATGFAPLDAQLPGGGLPRGGLVEVLHASRGIGELSFLLGALRQVAAEGRAIAWIQPPHLPYAPALASHGVPLEACLVVRPATPEEALWSADQALRSGACGAALFWLPEKTDYAALRRLQMAAEAGRCLAILFRSPVAAMQSTPAHLRIALSASEGHLLVTLPKRRGPPLTRPVALSVRPQPARRTSTPTLVSLSAARHARVASA